MSGKHNGLFVMLHGDECLRKAQDGGRESGLQLRLGRSHGEDDILAKTKQRVMPVSGERGTGISYRLSGEIAFRQRVRSCRDPKGKGSW